MRRALRLAARCGAVALIGMVQAAPLLACPVCFGDPSNAQTKGTRVAVFFLMGLTALMVGGVSWLFLRIARHARQAGEPVGDAPGAPPGPAATRPHHDGTP